MRISKSTKTSVKASCNSGDYKQCLKDALVAKGGYKKSDVEDASISTLESWCKDAGIDIVFGCGDVKASNYKVFDTHGGDSKLNKYSGQRVEVIRSLTEEEADLDEVGMMYKVRLPDGTIVDAFEDELEDDIDACGDIKASTSTDKALQHIKAAIDILGKSGKKDDVTMDSIANLATVMFDMNSSKSDK